MTNKERITISVDKQVLEWIDEKISDSIYAHRSHCFEFAVKQLMKKS